MEKDEVMPEGAWEFDDTVTAVFDDMLRRSIPQYELMRDTVHRLGRRHVFTNSHIWDLGCSTGEGLVPFVTDHELRKHNIRFLGIEISDPMIEEAQTRFEKDKNVSILKLDLAAQFPNVLLASDIPSLILSVLTLQFVPIERRQRVLQRAYDHLKPGGAFILVEKITGETANLDDDFVDLYYEGKRKQGYTQEQIERKRLSLEGVLVPLTAKWNEDMLRRVGFKEIDCFWRYLNFSGWIAIKSE